MVYGCLTAIAVERCPCDRDHLAHKTDIITIWSFIKKLIDPCHCTSLCDPSHTFLSTFHLNALLKCLLGLPSSFYTIFSLGHISTGRIIHSLISCLFPSPAWGVGTMGITLFTATSQHPENCLAYSRHSINTCDMTEEPLTLVYLL